MSKVYVNSSIYTNINKHAHEQMTQDLKTGDIILFSGKCALSSLIEYMTDGQWSHVGIVIKNPTYLINKPYQEGLFLYESGEAEMTDIDTGHKLFGVQMVDLRKYVESYSGTVAYRQLLWDKNPHELDNMMRIIYNTTYHKPYDWNPIDLLSTILYHKYWVSLKDNRRVDKFFCSSFVGYIYTQLGLLKPDTEWSQLYPKFFGDIIDLENGGKLGDVKVLVKFV